MFMSQARLRGLPSPMICLSSPSFPSKRKRAVLGSLMGSVYPVLICSIRLTCWAGDRRVHRVVSGKP
jgi:hypothetical protein